MVKAKGADAVELISGEMLSLGSGVKPTPIAIGPNHHEAIRVVRLPVVGGGDDPVSARILRRPAGHMRLPIPAGREVHWRHTTLPN